MIDRPIAVISYNRPDLLERFLTSLKEQTVAVDPARVALFQDHGDPAEADCVTVFRAAFPEGEVFQSDTNLGVALNIDRAERHVFETLGADVAYFFEDDLILGPHYLEALGQLSDFALSEERVSYVAAYGQHRVDAAEQAERASEIVPMEHKWGFALTRRQWERQKPIIEPYLEIIRQRPYRQRDNAAIKAFYHQLGYAKGGTSQDGAKDVANAVLGTVKLMSLACFARYEGRDGLHMRPELFEELGYGKTEVFTGSPHFDLPSSDQLDAWVERLRASLKNPEGEAKMREKLIQELFGQSPYADFTPVIDEPDLQGWNGLHPALERHVARDKPAIIVDVGVWHGQSTVTLARAQNKERADGIVIAVDTFLGSPEHWTLSRPDVHKSLAFRNGRPNFYETFLSNVVLSGLDSQIVPIAQTSENAALILNGLGISPDLVHVDAAHEYKPVLNDIEIWWDLLRPGGLLVGDDFPWSSVARAVVHFSDRVGLPFDVDGPKWWIRKPATPS
jgi:SAM-dependent methyltransferase